MYGWRCPRLDDERQLVFLAVWCGKRLVMLQFELDVGRRRIDLFELKKLALRQIGHEQRDRRPRTVGGWKPAQIDQKRVRAPVRSGIRKNLNRSAPRARDLDV